MTKTISPPNTHAKTIIRRFEAQASLTPDAYAVKFQDQVLTYAEFNARVNQLTHFLRKHGVGPEVLIGVYMERSLELIISLYSILKAGGAYVPLEPDYPEARIQFMLDDTRVPVLLTQGRLRSRLGSMKPLVSPTVICVDSDWATIASEPDHNLDLAIEDSSLAYVIYTSGSTGQPKGVMNEHGAIYNHMAWMQSAFSLTSNDRVLLKTPFSFDVSGWELYVPLMYGGSLIVAEPGGHKDPHYLVSQIVDEQITVIHFVPSMLQVFLTHEAVEQCTSLRTVICSGEALPLMLQRQFHARLDAGLHNLYGPTEAAIHVTSWHCLEGTDLTTVPIGKPISNTSIYLLDDHLRPVPLGEEGELYIGGVQVARGYLNRPQLTAERFIPDPFSANPGACLYKTGDLARALPDGNIVYMGRLDHQVKIRGNRVELGEIEHVLAQHQDVKEVVVVADAHDKGDARLIAYFVPKHDLPVSSGGLRSFLAKQLPRYMIPNYFVQLNAIPLSSNGKVDRKALRAPGKSDFLTKQDYVAPRNQLERALASLAAELLDLDEVGIQDNFFDLGGNSLQAMGLLSRIRSTCQISIPAQSFFLDPTVVGLSRAAEAAYDSGIDGLERGQKSSEHEELNAESREDLALISKSNLTRMQFLIWMGQQTAPKVPLYNVVQAFAIHGPLHVPSFRQAFQRLIERNDILRTVIIQTDGIPQQQILDSVSVTIELFDFSTEPDPQVAYRSWLDKRKARILPFDKPLFDTALVKLASNHFVWYLCQHHIITDALSGDLIFKHVASSYTSLVEAESDEYVSPPQYVEHVTYEREVRQTADFSKAVCYWKELSKQPFSPTAFYGPSMPDTSFETLRISRDLGARRSAKIREIAQTGSLSSTSLDLSLFIVFATLLFTTLHRINGEKRQRLGTPFHGRPTVRSKGTIGLFIEMGMLQIELDRGETFASLAEKVLTQSLTGLAHIQPGVSSADTNQAYDVTLNFLQPAFASFAGLPVSYEWVHSGFMDRTQSLRLQITDFQGAGNFTLAFDMKTSVFSQHERLWLVEHFLEVVDAFISDHTQSIGAFALISAADKQKLVLDFNNTEVPYPRDKTVVQLFEDQVRRTPQEIAVRHSKKLITYAEFNKQANQLAHFLHARGVGPGVTVAICMERSLEVLIAIWAVLKTGGSYLPIDPAYPTQRIAYMLADAAPACLLVAGNIMAKGIGQGDNSSGYDIINVIDLDLSSFPASNPAPTAVPSDLAYLIYTSGSTGQPKGTMLTHQGLLNYAWWASRTYQQGGEVLDFALYSSLAFDLTITSIFVPLLSGGKVVVYSESDYARGLEILEVFRDDAVDIVKLTPAHLALVQQESINCQRIRKLIVGGEDFKTDLARKIYSAFTGGVEIYNEYGPTEAVVGCMLHKYDPVHDTASSVPIGKPAANARIYVVDEYDQPVPPGVIGEMLISGDGVGQGYLNRPELTAHRFGIDPFRPGARIYRTGDIAQWDEAGQLTFLGRRDNQVKIRGARIELGEVESALLAHPKINEVVVDVVQTEIEPSPHTTHCLRCGLPSNYPGSDFDAGGICSDCRAFARDHEQVARYFRTPVDLRAMLDPVKHTNQDRPYDCLVLLSGGKDSTYMLYRIVREYGMRPLVFTLDNGYISSQALDNIRRICADLQVDLEVGRTPHMNAIFADSLRRHSNVCNGCFKTIYTLSMNLAKRLGINTIITGLARGQLFETRLADTFRARCFEPTEIDSWILEARKAYHHIDDAVNQLLDVDVFQDERIFEEIHFVDFYRYTDVALGEVYAYLDAHTAWQRPDDTGRSTNCLINDAGIYIHQKERGYHNYALPYSWDVRLGHKVRETAMDELDDDIDVEKVHQMLAEVGYDPNEKHPQHSEKRLVAYYVSGEAITASELRAHLSDRLPDYMFPSFFTRLDNLPLTANGKVDRSALPDPEQARPALNTKYVLPTTQKEQMLVEIWQEVFGLAEIGIHDSFFDLGGDSIMSIQIVSKARQVGLHVTPRDLFEYDTIASLSPVASQVGDVTAEQGLVSGPVPLTPIQHWFFAQQFPDPEHWNQSVWLDLLGDVNIGILRRALQYLPRQHDTLRTQFSWVEDEWQQSVMEDIIPVPFTEIDLAHLPVDRQEQMMVAKAEELASSLCLETGPLIQAAVFRCSEAAQLFITVHHLVVDGVSWQPLLADLETAYEQLCKGEKVRLPQKTTSFKSWAEKLAAYAQAASNSADRVVWIRGKPVIPESEADIVIDDPISAETVAVLLDSEQTEQLLKGIHSANNSSTNEVLLAAWARAFAEWADSDLVSIMVEGHGREESIFNDVDLSRTVGWFTIHYPLHLSLSRRSSPREALAEAQSQLRRITDNGLRYGIDRYVKPRIDTPQSEALVLFNYLGQFERALSGSNLFRFKKPLRADCGPTNQQTYRLEVNVYVWQNQLQANLNFDSSQFSLESIETLCGLFMHSLKSLIAHCLTSEVGGFSASDFALADLTDTQFEDLANLLNDLDG